MHMPDPGFTKRYASRKGGVMMFKGFVLSITASLAAALTGCHSVRVQNYTQIDPANKTVTVPPGSSALKGELKHILAKNGWKMDVYLGPSVTEGHLGKDTNLQHYETFNTRYRLLVSSDQFDICFDLSPDINYDISFVDNETGSEAFTVSGHGCQSTAVKAFEKALLGKGG